MSVNFSTSLVPASDRVDAWQWNARQFCGDCRFQFPNPRRFQGSIDTKKVGQLELSLFSSTSLSFAKFPVRDMHSVNTYCTVIAQLEGVRSYSQSGNRVALIPGDSTIIDSMLPWSSDCHDHCERLYLRVPRWMIEDRLHRAAMPCASRISGSSAQGKTLFQYANSLYRDADSLSLEEAAASVQAYLDILAGCLTEGFGDSGWFSNGRELCSRIARFIDENLHEPILGPALIAAEMGISTRHLHRLMAETGHTLGEWIRERRLEQCRRDLADSRLRERSVTEIAFSWGFCEAAHFSRCFKKRFGVSPREFRSESSTSRWIHGNVAEKLRVLPPNIGHSQPN